ncbi:uncharacterized protein LOC123440612 isoform X1 [Hordeum vulgare subsp. vulgare]|uniref:Uncharacterized protein n=1 Tax=Hordeum vulgare subsp. vulgare TaxID=112509 RepID=A0A8I6XHR5_HORVV|nr:uncharacterized protein LOC123440612 isoform X1 [Hordeum vulgare subsp. vulgare]
MNRSSGGHQLSHELCAVIMMRFGQIDSILNCGAVGTRWRKFMEPDIATFAAADIDPSSIKSMHCQFKQDSISFKVPSCRMYFVPSIRPDGWCVYAMDFVRKHITVLDPVAGSSGFSNKNIKVHEHVSNKILDCLIKCAKEFYSDWPHKTERWSRSFRMITECNFNSVDSGICLTYLAKFFDGERLVKPMNKENVDLHRAVLLYDVMRLDANLSHLSANVLEFIKTSFHLL